MHHYDKLYRTPSIGNVGWFVIALPHLYNACQQVGGLSLPWPGLEFIMKTHGVERVFIGSNPPGDANKFPTRLVLAMCLSTRVLAKGHRGKPCKARKEERLKRGLMPFLPLEEKIQDMYRLPKENRWIRRQNLFVYLIAQMKKVPNDDAQNVPDIL